MTSVAACVPAELITGLSDELVLSIVLGRFMDEDTLFLVLTSINKHWREELQSSTLLYRELCLSRAWVHLAQRGLPIPHAVSDWPARFKRRPRLRMGGPFVCTQLFMQFTGPRTMWTPKDTKAIEVIHHHRVFWMGDDGTCVYAAVSTDNLDRVIDQVRRVRVAVDRGQRSLQGDVPLPQQQQQQRVWVGQYELQRDDERGLVVTIEVRMRIHKVVFEAVVQPGGSQCRIERHLSVRYDDPTMVLNHMGAAANESYRTMFYKPGFL